jgi:ADP-heptose:LPS heptosyltransferase
LRRNLTKNTEMRLLVIRTSAMGDVALTTPVLRVLREQYPDIEILFLTRPAFKPFFTSIEGLLLFLTDFKDRHEGIMGILRLFKDIRKQGEIDYVIDLHDVMRSKILRSLFILYGVPVSVIDKGRNEKRSLLKGKKKNRLSHSVERYQDGFLKAGFKTPLSKGPWIIPSSEAITNAVNTTKITSGLNIGVAPYAKHNLKMWPEENMISLLLMISDKFKAKFWLFGGKEESERLISFQNKVPGSISLAGKINLEEELALMTRLTFMIAMDSSNMHMAALTGTKVVTIWGATDPLTGFGAWMQPEDFSIRIPVDELTCRPCTIYGKGSCRRGDHACMKWLTPGIVFQKIEKMLLSGYSK